MLVVTAYRQASHPKDMLFGAYGLIDVKWCVEENPQYKLQDVWKLTVEKYIENFVLAPLLSDGGHNRQPHDLGCRDY